MSILNILVAAIIAIIVYVVCTALVTFRDSTLIFGLLAVAIFISLGFSGHRYISRR